LCRFYVYAEHMRSFAILLTVLLAAQESKPVFEVVSIKPNATRSDSAGTSTTDHSLSAQNVTVRSLIQSAYRVQSHRIVGGPDWVNTDRFNVEAKMEPDPMPSRAPIDPTRPDRPALMMQSMLEDRFRLKTHREMRELSVYFLVVGKDGARLKRPVEGQTGPAGPDAGSVNTNGSRARIQLRGSSISMVRLAAVVGNQLDRPIVDKTNLSGEYDVILTWTPQGAEDISPSPDAAPTVFTALQEQLGLKLESGKDLVEVLVIDSAQKPSEN
jgi:uncharacterized protein (TIGR03435 family)